MGTPLSIIRTFTSETPIGAAVTTAGIVLVTLPIVLAILPIAPVTQDTFVLPPLRELGPPILRFGLPRITALGLHRIPQGREPTLAPSTQRTDQIQLRRSRGQRNRFRRPTFRHHGLNLVHPNSVAINAHRHPEVQRLNPRGRTHFHLPRELAPKAGAGTKVCEPMAAGESQVIASPE